MRLILLFSLVFLSIGDVANAIIPPPDALLLTIRVDRIEDKEGVVIADVTLSGRIVYGPLLSEADHHRALLIAGEIDFGETTRRLAGKGVDVQFKTVRGSTELFIKAALGKPTAFVVCKRMGQTSRYRILLFKQERLNLEEVATYASESKKEGDTASAVRAWQFLLQQYKLHLPANYGLAQYYFKEGDYRKAAELFERVLDLDQRNWKYPEARLGFALVQQRLDLPLGPKHVMCLEEYLRHPGSADPRMAEQLLGEVRDPVVTKRLSKETAIQLKKILNDKARAIITFVPADCSSCQRHLDELFIFASRNQRVDYYVVFMHHEKSRIALNKEINSWFAIHKRNNRHSSIQFFDDPSGHLPALYWANEDISNDRLPRTLFLKEGTVVRSDVRLTAWDRLSTELIWSSR